MRQFARQLRSLNLARLWLCFLTAWFFVVISGLPLPMLREVIRDSDIATAASNSIHGGKVHKVEKDRSQAFPCMFSSCGCNNAEQCWRQCCCHDLKSKLAWAKRNHVTPPDYVIAEARQKGLLGADESLAIFSESSANSQEQTPLESKVSESKKPTCPHCSAKKESSKSCCQSDTICCEPAKSNAAQQSSCCKVEKSVKESCCKAKKTCCVSRDSCCDSESVSDSHSQESHACCCKKSSPPSEPEISESNSSTRSIIALQALRCRGESLNMLGYAPMLPVQQVHTVKPENLLIERLVVSSDQASKLSLDILTPPPWV